MAPLRRTVLIGLGALALLLAIVAGALALWFPHVLKLGAQGEVRELRDRKGPRPARPPGPGLVIVALDGVDRDLLYGLLGRGELPGFARLLGGQVRSRLPHAHLADDVLATMPSSTIPGWATLYTATPPGHHGVTGNEFFIRERRFLAAPAPVSFEDATPVLSIYTEDTADALLEVPTIYQRMRAEDPGIRIWVSMGQFHRGADRLLLARRTVLAAAFRGFLEKTLGAEDGARDVYAALDREALETVTDELGSTRADEWPDVLSIYLAGIDLHTHHADGDPDVVRRDYLREILDPKMGELAGALERGRLADRHVVVVSEHGHTRVLPDDARALGAAEDDELPTLLRGAGFRVRPFAVEVDDDHDFQAVVAYGGATAFVYLADRSTCPEPGQRCDFRRPPRFEEDVLPVAEAALQSSRTGAPVAGLRGALDLVLTRRPRPFDADDEPFAVYLGGGRLEAIDDHLAREPRDGYLATSARLADLATGPHGERAGDILLLARSGAEPTASTRYYFSKTYHSWHGSPGRKDSELPLIVARPGADAEALGRTVTTLLGETPRLQDVGRLLVELGRRTRAR